MKILDDFTGREVELFEQYFRVNLLDGMSRVYHLEQSDVDRVKRELTPNELKAFKRVLAGLEKCFGKDAVFGFDLILQT